MPEFNSGSPSKLTHSRKPIHSGHGGKKIATVTVLYNINLQQVSVVALIDEHLISWY